MLSKDRCKTTSGFFVIPLLSQLWEEKNYCERRNELSSWRPVALPNRHKHLCLFKLGYDMHALLSSVMYILSGKKITAVYPMSRCRWDQNTSQVANRLNRARATYVWLLHVPPCSVLVKKVYCFCFFHEQNTQPCQLELGKSETSAVNPYIHVENFSPNVGIQVDVTFQLALQVSDPVERDLLGPGSAPLLSPEGECINRNLGQDWLKW